MHHKNQTSWDSYLFHDFIDRSKTLLFHSGGGQRERVSFGTVVSSTHGALSIDKTVSLIFPNRGLAKNLSHVPSGKIRTVALSKRSFPDPF